MKHFISIYLFVLSCMGINAQTEVGTTTGTFSVSPTGAATYTIPIPLRDGQGGFTPQIALTYNSQAGNGVVGYGWEISGLSSITATPHSKYYDTNNIRGINVDATDAYTLDGQRLLLKSGSNGKAKTYYTTEEEQYCNIYIDNAYTTTPQSFVVQQPDGTTLRYGSSTGICKYASDKAFAWMLDYAEDKNGNYTKYIYTNYDGLPYLTTVQYGRNNNGGTTSFCSVEFTYDNRTDTIVTHVKDKKFYTTKRLSTIICKYYGTQYNKFQLSYNNTSHYSHLTAVKEYGADNNGFPATTFQWTNLPNVNLTSQGVSVTKDAFSQYESHYYVTGDVDNDGKTELIGILPHQMGYSKVNIFKKSGNSFSSNASYQIEGNHGIDRWGYANILRGGVVGNFGKSNGNTVIIPILSVEDETQCSVRFRFVTENFYFSSPLLFSVDIPAYSIADFDKDGKDAIIYIEKKSMSDKTIRLSTIDVNTTQKQASEKEQRFQFNSLTSSQQADEIKDCIAGDFDGDGLIDLLVVCKNYSIMLWNNNGNFVANDYAILTNIKYGDTFQTADFNGDGLIDLIINEPSSTTWKKAINTGVKGSSIFMVSNISVLASKNVKKQNDNDSLYNCIINDFNSDGFSDLMVSYKSGNYQKVCWLKAERSGSFSVVKEVQSSHLYPVTGVNIAQGDFDGDGYVEFIGYGGDLYAGGSTSKSWHLYKNSSYAINNNKITTITEGLLKKTGITYCSLLDGYTNTASTSFPLMRFYAPLPVVNTSSESWKNTTYTTTYSYANGIVHLAGKGFLGFQTQTSQGNGTKQVTTLAVNSSYYVPYMTSVETRGLDNTIISSHSYTYTFEVGDVAKSYKKNLTHESIGDVIANKSQTVTYSQFHYGKPCSVTSSSYITKKTTCTYTDIKNNGYWILGLPLTVDTESSVEAYNGVLDKFYDRTVYTYDGYGRVIKKQDYKSDVASNQYITNTEQYQYDTRGYLINSKSVAYAATDTLTTTHAYDTYGRLTRTVAPDGHPTNYTYNSIGLLTAENDEWFSTRISSTYDGVARLKRRIKSSTINMFTPDTLTVSYTFTNTNNHAYKVTTTNSHQPTTTDYYDGFGRLVASGSIHFDGKEYVTETSYLNANVKGFESVPHAYGTSTDAGTTYTYDSRFRPVQITDPEGNTVGDEYHDSSVDVTKNGVTTHYEYNQDGSLSQRIDPQGDIYYFYKATGEYEKIRFSYMEEPDLFATYTYDKYGRLTQLTDPNGDVRKYAYNTNGRLYQYIFGGNAERYIYNKYGDITKKTFVPQSSNASAVYSYNSKRLLTSVTSPGVSDSYSYNASGQLMNHTRAVTVEGRTYQKSSTYAYNGESQLKSITSTLNGVSFPVVESYEYQRGWTKSIKLNNRLVWQLTGENPQGRTSTVKNRLGTIYYAYDQCGRITLNNGAFHISGGNASISHSYAYDEFGYLTTKDGKQYTYDDYNQLASWNGKSYSCDAWGNVSMSGQATTFNKYKLTSANVPRVWGRNNLQVAYNGNQQPWRFYLLGLDHDPQGEATLNYDSEGNRISMVKYDYLEPETLVNGELIPPVMENDFIRAYVDDCYEVNDCEPTYTIPTHYYYVGGDPLSACAVAEIYNNNMKLWQINRDHQGSITEMGDSVTIKRYYYDPWGRYCDASGNMASNIYAKGGKANNPFYRGFLGQEHLLDYGLINLNARLYDPFIGRFLTPDPIYDASRSILDFNPYMYGKNCPSIYVDPDGKFIFTVFNAVHDLVRNIGKHGFNISQYSWSRTVNSWKIDMGMFKGNFGQVLNKWTKGLPVSAIGNIVAHGYNFVGGIDNVTVMDGMLALSGATGSTFRDFGIPNEKAFTIGHYSFGPKGYKADWRDHLFVHEYGHYIQSQQWGVFYFPAIGIPSFFSAAGISSINHDKRWFEVNANKLGAKYFDKHYGRGAKGYDADSPNYFDVKSFWNGHKTLYTNPRRNDHQQLMTSPHTKQTYTIWDFLIL